MNTMQSCNLWFGKLHLCFFKTHTNTHTHPVSQVELVLLIKGWTQCDTDPSLKGIMILIIKNIHKLLSKKCLYILTVLLWTAALEFKRWCTCISEQLCVFRALSLIEAAYQQATPWEQREWTKTVKFYEAPEAAGSGDKTLHCRLIKTTDPTVFVLSQKIWRDSKDSEHVAFPRLRP